MNVSIVAIGAASAYGTSVIIEINEVVFGDHDLPQMGVVDEGERSRIMRVWPVFGHAKTRHQVVGGG